MDVTATTISQRRGARRPAVGAACCCLLAGALLAACADRSSAQHDMPLPERFERVPPTAAAAGTDAAFANFGSLHLQELLDAAAVGNADIGVAVARVRQADARARQAGAALLPSLDFAPDGTQYAGGTRHRDAHELDWSAAFTASYEFDFWGKLRAAHAAATATAQASRADLATARMTVRAGVANLYFQAQSSRERLELARANLKSTADVLAFLEARAQVGLVTPAELASQRALVAVARLQIPELEQQQVESLAALALLVGRVPEGFTVATEDLAAIREPALEAGLPSELLARRPDIAAAERNLDAAHADLLAARAAFFPDISLSAGGGIANPAVNAAVNVLSGTGYSLTLGANLVQTIFDGGRRRAVAAEAQAREEELLITYRAAIRAALSDVETALAGVQHLDEQREAQESSVAQSTLAFEGWKQRFRTGAVQYVAVLEAQRSLIAARDQYGLYRLARLQAFVNLSKALGGGWQDGGAHPDLASAVAAP
jgi:multidrug efflux system outer membrane protein